MILERVKTPGLAHVAYLIGNKGEGAVVDPRRDIEEYLTLARKHKLTIKYVIETHRQEDFVMGSAELARQCGAKVINGRHHAFGHGDIRLDDGEAFDIATGLRIVALHTPGHTPESMCYAVYLDDSPDRAWAVFSGDTLFIGESGRTDLTDPLQTAQYAGQLYDAVHAKLLPLGDQAILFPAHGAGSACGGNIAERDDSTIGLERHYNPVFVRSRQAFVQAKLDERIPRPPYFRYMEQVNAKGGLGPPLATNAVRVLQPKEFRTESRLGVVFDLRLPEAFAGGHVPGSYSIWAEGLPVFAGWIAEPGTPIELVVHAADVRGWIVSGTTSARFRAAREGSLMAEMNTATQNALGGAMGVLFGALLQRGGLGDSRTIVGQLTGDDSRVVKTMGTAVALGALGHRMLRLRGLTAADPKPMNPVGLVGGAVLFGAGMALSGYCPGTAAAAAGSGRREGVWAMAGMLVAATAFVATYPRLKKTLEAGTLGRVNLLDGRPARRAPPPLGIVVRPRAAAHTLDPLKP